MTERAEVAYIRFGTEDVIAAAAFAADLIGLQSVPNSGDEAWFRSDIRRRTLIWQEGVQDDGSVGVAYHRSEALAAAVNRLREAGVPVEAVDSETCSRLFVREAYRIADPSGNRIDLVYGPHHAGRRFFPARDNGIKELQGISLRSTDTDRDAKFWCDLLGFAVRDWAGQVCYIGMDELHHRVALYPSLTAGILSVNLAVEDLDLIMQNFYWMEEHQVKIVQGPGRAAASGQIFLRVEGCEGLVWEFAAEMTRVDPQRHRPRQFSADAASLCTWGSNAAGVTEFTFDLQRRGSEAANGGV